VPPGGTLGIYGFGSSASVTIQVARARGAQVFVCTREPRHRELAREMGAAWVGETTEAMPQPVDGAIIFAPAGELVPVALRSLARGGTLALAGIHMSRIPPLDYDALFQERRVTSVTANTRADGEELLAEAIRIPIRPAVTTFPLEDANRALLALKQGSFSGSGVLVP
jgi:alcohol dehydrogenase, propanol-preferring